MMRRALILFCTLSALLTSGCVAHRWSTPEVIGRISDSASGVPIKAATIYWEAAPSKPVTSKDDGSFSLRPVREYWQFIGIPIGDPLIYSGDVVVEAPGFTKSVTHIRGGIGYRRSESIEVRLEKKTADPAATAQRP